MSRCCSFYDIRFLLLPVVILLKSYADAATLTDDIITKEVMLVLVFGVLAAFLLTSIRIQCCYQPRNLTISSESRDRLVYELRFGRSALSVPISLSLATCLFLPLSAFVYAYIAILVLSFWSDSIHSFFTRSSHIEHRRLFCLPVSAPMPFLEPYTSLEGGTEQGANVASTEDAATIDLRLQSP